MKSLRYLFGVLAVFFASSVFAAEPLEPPAAPSDQRELQTDTVKPAEKPAEALEPVKKVKANHLDLVLVLDRSGSMNGLQKDTIGGFNSMIKKQKDNKVDTYVTTVLFNDKNEILYDRKKISDIPEMTDKDYVPGGMTALLDAVGVTINRIDKVENVNAPDHKVVFVIITDGQENYSQEYRVAQIKEMISTRQEKFGWEFVFLGANIDAVGEAGKLGISESNAVKYRNSGSGVQANFNAISDLAGEAVMDEAERTGEWKKQIEQDK